MEILREYDGWQEILIWQNQEQEKLKKINQLNKDIGRNPFERKSKPEALKGNLSGFYSRRINHEHRLVYAIKDDTIYIISCKGHYE